MATARAAPPRCGQAPHQQRRHPVVGDQLGAQRASVARPRHRRWRPRRSIDSAARMPVTSAWPMPSPVITSHAAAASPTNSVRVGGGHHGVDPGGDGPGPVRLVGDARPGRAPPGCAVGPAGPARAASCPGWSSGRRAGCRSRCWPGRRAAGTTRSSPGTRSASNETYRSLAASGPTSDDVLAERVPLAAVAARRPRRAACAAVTTCRRRRSPSGRGRCRRPSTSSSTASAVSRAATIAWPSSTSAPALRARSTSAASRSRRVAIATYWPVPSGSENRVVRPDGERIQQSCGGHPRLDVAGIESEVLEVAQRAGGEPVAADLVAGERGLVDHDDVEPGTGAAVIAAAVPGRSRSDHDHVDRSHRCRGYGRRSRIDHSAGRRSRRRVRPGPAGRRRRCGGTP